MLISIYLHIFRGPIILLDLFWSCLFFAVQQVQIYWLSIVILSLNGKFQFWPRFLYCPLNMFTTIRSQCDFDNEKSLQYFKLLRKVSTWDKFALVYLFLVQNVNYSISEVVGQQAVAEVSMLR